MGTPVLVRRVQRICCALTLLASSLAPALAQTVETTAAGSGLVLKDSAGSLLSAMTTTGAEAGFMMVFDSATVPADGPVTPKYCVPIAANNFAAAQWAVWARFATGITIVFSTTGCFTKTASATAFFSAQVQ